MLEELDYNTLKNLYTSCKTIHRSLNTLYVKNIVKRKARESAFIILNHLEFTVRPRYAKVYLTIQYPKVSDTDIFKIRFPMHVEFANIGGCISRTVQDDINDLIDQNRFKTDIGTSMGKYAEYDPKSDEVYLHLYTMLTFDANLYYEILRSIVDLSEMEGHPEIYIHV